MKSQSKGLKVSFKWQLLHWGIEFKLFISNWKRFDLYFPLLKPKNQARFLLPFRQSKWKHESMKANLSQKAMKLAPNDNYMSIFVSFTSYIHKHYIQSYWKKKIFFGYKYASFVPSNAGMSNVWPASRMLPTNGFNVAREMIFSYVMHAAREMILQSIKIWSCYSVCLWCVHFQNVLIFWNDKFFLMSFFFGKEKIFLNDVVFFTSKIFYYAVRPAWE